MTTDAVDMAVLLLTSALEAPGGPDAAALRNAQESALRDFVPFGMPEGPSTVPANVEQAMAERFQFELALAEHHLLFVRRVMALVTQLVAAGAHGLMELEARTNHPATAALAEWRAAQTD